MKQLNYNYTTLLTGLLLFKLIQANEEKVELPITPNNNIQTAAASSLISSEGSRRHRLTLHRKSRRRQLLVESLRSSAEDEFSDEEEMEDAGVVGERLLQKKKKKNGGNNNKRKKPNNNVNKKKEEKKNKIKSDIKKERIKKLKKPGSNKEKVKDDDSRNDPGWCLCEDVHPDNRWNGDSYDDDWSNDVASPTTSKRKKFKNTRNKKRKDGRFLLILAEEEEEEFHAAGADSEDEDDLDAGRLLKADELTEDVEEGDADDGANEEESDTASLADVFSAAAASEEDEEDEDEEGEGILTLMRFKKKQNNKKKVNKRNDGGKDKWESFNHGQQGSWGGDEWGGDEWGGGGGAREKPRWCPCPVLPTEQPTYAPTFVTFPPTLSPTLDPTVEPTMYPTQDPTRSPSMQPTVHPTPRPTRQPTNPPTSKPTPHPTPKPTPRPTHKPSPYPTSSPTSSPTKRPTRGFPNDGFNWGEKAAVGGSLGQTQPIPARFHGGLPITDITAGPRYTLYLDVDGNAFASGYVESLLAYQGQFGVGFSVTLGSNYDKQVNSVWSNGAVRKAPSFQSVYTGSDHSAFIDKDGQVYLTGSNSYGQLCLDEDSEMKNFPHLVKLPPNRVAVDVALGLDFTLILLDNGRVYGCGSNRWGQLGLGDTASVRQPTLIGESLGRITAVSAGGDFSLYLTEDGKAYSSGNNAYRQQCRNTDGKPVKTVTQIINPGLSVLGIEGGRSSSYLLLTDGGLNSRGVASCGSNSQGQLCGKAANANGRAEVELDASILATGIWSGPAAETVFFTGVDKTNGRDVVYGCGRNDFDQVGIGSNQPSRISTPKRVSLLGSKRFSLKISASTSHSVAMAIGAVIPSKSEAPSSSPSLQPSSPPTEPISPTKEPTSSPTKAPTSPPTKAPTNPPTKAPTFSPTKAPTHPPTNAPTKAPTHPPTNAPTKAPVPTHPPTNAPTKAPVPPTNPPTKAPTPPPTNPPTKAPIPPTNPPTKAPTPPTNPPTHPPTSPPTNPPTHPPTSPPTNPPTHPPTNMPTKEPNPRVRITATDLAQPSTSDTARFGRSVAISGGSALVGAPNADDDGNVFGAVYLFETLTGNAQKYESKLDAPAPTPSNVRFRCGHSVALSEKYFVMGCPGFKDYDKDSKSYSEKEIGAVSIYERGFTAPLLIQYQQEVNAEFGTSVAINSAGIVAVGTKRGFVELYDMNLKPPNKPFRTLGSDLIFDQLQDNFGWSVALNDDDWLAVGAIKQDSGKGSVFLWRNLSTKPEEIPAPAAAQESCGELINGDPVEGDCEFGYSVAFSGKNLVVGSPSTRYRAGRAFIYDLTLDDYKDKVQTLPANPLEGSEFGFSVAMTDEAVVVGSRKYRSNVNRVARGAAYYFNKDKNGKWYLPSLEDNNQNLVQNPIVGESEDGRFGASVAINDKAFVVGAPYESNKKGEAGAFSYELATNPSSNGAVAEGEESSNRSSPGRPSSPAKVVNLAISDVCTLAYRVNDLDTLTITVELVCEGVEEWIGIGFSSDGLMQNSEAVLGIPGNDMPLRYALNGKSVDTVVRMPDEEQTLIGASLQVLNNAQTVMKFTKALENEAGEEIFLLFARGATSSIGYHAERSAVKITL